MGLIKKWLPPRNVTERLEESQQNALKENMYFHVPGKKKGSLVSVVIVIPVQYKPCILYLINKSNRQAVGIHPDNEYLFTNN